MVMSEEEKVFASNGAGLSPHWLKRWTHPVRYERGEITPSIGDARKLAEVLEVTLDYLVGDNELSGIQDKAQLDRWQSLDTLKTEDRERILYVIDSLMWDDKTR